MMELKKQKEKGKENVVWDRIRVANGGLRRDEENTRHSRTDGREGRKGVRETLGQAGDVNSNLSASAQFCTQCD